MIGACVTRKLVAQIAGLGHTPDKHPRAESYFHDEIGDFSCSTSNYSEMNSPYYLAADFSFVTSCGVKRRNFPGETSSSSGP